MMTVNGQRLQAHLEALADIARTPDGICRLSYSDSFWKSNAYVAQLMREAGMSVTTNPVGNVVGTYPGRSPRKITIGSHIDSVVNGGIFDGCLGVLAGIEAVHTLSEKGIVPEHSIDVVSFAEEEGIVITGLIGSRAYCGLPPTEPVLEKMGEFGFTLQDLAEAKYTGDIDYSLELHIEQGGVLESQKKDIGVVRSIIALRRYIVEFAGVANHAGTTPMTLRNDALVKAARFIMRVRQVVMETDPHMVGTVGGAAQRHERGSGPCGFDAGATGTAGGSAGVRLSDADGGVPEGHRLLPADDGTALLPYVGNRAAERPERGPEAGTCGDDYGQRSRSRQHEPLAGDEGRHDFCPKRQGNQPQQRGVHDVGRCDQWSKCPLARPV